MAVGYIVGAGGGGGVTSADVTARKENVLEGVATVTSDSGDAVANGTMVNRGNVNHTLGVNGSYTIPQGYHAGSGKVTQSLVTKAAHTYGASTSDQTIAANQYLTGAQTIKAVTQNGLSAGNIKNGVTVTVASNGTNLFSVTGSYTGTKSAMTACAASGTGMGAAHPDHEDQSFTMPLAGQVYYSGMVAAYNGIGKCAVGIYKNGTLVANREINSDYYIRPQLQGSFAAAKGDVIAIRADTSSGAASIGFIHAICIY